MNPQGLPHTLLRRARMPFRHSRKINERLTYEYGSMSKLMRELIPARIAGIYN